MDKKAIKILKNTIKTSWKEVKGYTASDWENYMKYVSEEDFNYAKEKSVMFDREQLTHNEIFTRIKTAVSKIEKQDVVNAFLFSLSTRQLEYRSFLSSYCIGKNIIEHDFIACPEPNERICSVCGLYTFQFEKITEHNTTMFFKYNYGFCFVDAISVMFDLEQFPKFPKVEPKQEDYEILNQIKTTIKNSDDNDRPSQLKKKMAQVIKSNDEERLSIIEILGVIGILHDDEHFGYADKYVTFPERKHRPIKNDDVEYPARWWQGKFGVDEEKWNYWFENK